ncbi:MAG: hypothetical protein ACXVRK_00955 [Gaiellaceae bacterium]
MVERNPDLIVEKQGVAAVAADGASWRSGHVARIEARRLDSESADLLDDRIPFSASITRSCGDSSS